MGGPLGNKHAVGNKGGGRLRKFTSANEMFDVGLRYIEDRISKEQHLTITGLYIALGIVKSTFLEYESGRYDDDINVFSDLLKELKQRIEDYAENRLFGNNPTGAIFALKNYGWKDKTETELTGPNGGPIQLTNVTKLPDADLLKLEEILARNEALLPE